MRPAFNLGDDIEYEAILRTDEGDMPLWTRATVLEIFEADEHVWYIIDGDRWIAERFCRHPTF